MSGRRTNPGRKLGSTRKLRQNVHNPELAEEEQEPHAKPEKDIPAEANSQGSANVKENAAALNTIQEIFHDCDTEAKGFITRADMQKLAADLPLTSEELEQVFQSLDREGNGFITNEDFSEGLRKFMETPLVMSEGRPKDEEASTHVDPKATVDINVRGFSTSQKRRKVGSSRRQPRAINPEGWLGTLTEETTDGPGIITHGDLQASATIARRLCSGPGAEDKLYNVVFIGESSVGKTSFIKKFCNGVFRLDLCATVGIDSCLRSLTVGGEQFVLQLWDTAGQERYHSITKQIFRKADGIVLMYDVTSSRTYVAVRYWLSCIEEGTNGDLPVLLLGNKTDISEKREVQVQEGGSLAKEYGFQFMECSAASGYNVNESMASLAR
uniref:Uncharacterized LOC114647884 n=1 Tax=Erpetoichthys calabaricus TaxID=27687 RepID=A0A8C4SQ82_ERPCA